MFSVNIQYIHFLNFGRGFAISFLLFPEVPASCDSLRFLKSYFRLEILIFLFFVVSFLVDMYNKKAPFLTKKY